MRTCCHCCWRLCFSGISAPSSPSLSHPGKVNEGDFRFLGFREVPSRFYFLLPDILIGFSVAHWPFFYPTMFHLYSVLPFFLPSIFFFLLFCQYFVFTRFFSLSISFYLHCLPLSVSFLSSLLPPFLFPLSISLSFIPLDILHSGNWHFWLMLPSSPSWPFYATSSFLFSNLSFTLFFFIAPFFGPYHILLSLFHFVLSPAGLISQEETIGFPSGFHLFPPEIFNWFWTSLASHFLSAYCRID